MADNQIVYDDELLFAAENDMETSVGEDFDPDAEYNAPPPPLPDGWHQAKLVNRGVKVDDVTKEFAGPRPWGNIPSTYWTMVEAQIVDVGGPQNNKRASGNITTHNEKTQDGRNRGSSANMYYKAIKGEPLPGVSQGSHIAAVAKELRAEPIVWIRTRLEGQDQDAQKDFKARKQAGTLKPGEKAPVTYRGESEFRQNAEGAHDPKGRLTGVRVVVNEDGDEVRIVGRPVIQEVKPLSFVPPVKK